MGQFTNWLHETFRTSKRRHAAEAAANTMESLEPRLLLSGIIWQGPVIDIGTDTGHTGDVVAVGMDAGGKALVAACDDSYGESDITGQFFYAGGRNVSTVVVLVPSAPNLALTHPSLAMSTDGEFVLAWQQVGCANRTRFAHGMRGPRLGDEDGPLAVVDLSSLRQDGLVQPRLMRQSPP